MKVFKRTVTGMISFVMVITAMNLPGATTNVCAAEGPQLPSVTKFATPSEFVDANIFTLHTDNGNGVAQKVNFGNGKTWYIAGEDGDGSLVLMCDPANSLGSKEFDYSENSYEDSVIRAFLQGKALDNFTDEEKALMSSPTVYTGEWGSVDVYTTSDELYLAYGDYTPGNDSYITVGTNSDNSLNNGIKIGLKTKNSPDGSPFANTDNVSFWLRTPMSVSTNSSALVAVSGQYVVGTGVTKKYAVMPAFHLNLSSVLFASAATVASSNPSLGEAMTFRIKNSGQFASTAQVNRHTISVAYDDNDSGVFLYVQGNNGSDWVGCAEITETKEYTLNDIGVPEDADLSKCHVWLEKTVTDENLTYAEYASVAPTYPVKVSSDDVTMGSAVAKVNDSAVVEAFEGEKVTLEATANAGYDFDYWESSPAVEITDDKFLMPAESITITAHFKQKSSPAPDVPECNHAFVWKTITSPTATTFGTEGYECTKCGVKKDVREKSPFDEWVRMQINNAKPGVVLKLDFGPWNSFPLWMMQMIADKPTVTYVLNYTYQGKKYEVTIKPGDKFALDCEWYGPLKTASMFDTVITKQDSDDRCIKES